MSTDRKHVRGVPSRRPLGILPVLTAWLAAAAVPAAEDTGPSDGARHYEECMALARTDPRRALESASAWRSGGGGAPAGHCAATAMAALGRHAEAARRLEALARDSRDPRAARFRADLYAQAGSSWLVAGMAGAAERVLDQALALRPGDAEILLDRGLARATGKRFWEALKDFNRVLADSPDRVDALVLRAAAHREIDALDLAEKDLDRALELDPKRPDALLELGILLARKKDLAGARDAWRALLTVSPKGPEADIARKYLAQIEVGGKPP